MFLNSPRTALYSKIQSWLLVQKWFEEVDFEHEEKFRKTYKNLCQLNFHFQFSCSVMSDSLWLHGLQHAWLPCPSPTPGVYSNSHPWSWWLNFFTSSNKFLVETSGIFLLEYHVICKLWHVYFFSSSLDVFYFFSCYWARTSNIVLSRRDNSGFPWLVPDFRGKAFSFSPLSLMLLVSLVYMAFIVFKHVPFMPSLTEKKFYTSFLVSSSSDIFFLIVESDWK